MNIYEYIVAKYLNLMQYYCMIKTRKRNRADQLYALAESQRGYFTAGDAKSAGYDYALQHFHVQRGNWIRADRGIFRLKRFPSGEYEDLLRWWLWSRKEGALSHESAAAVYGLGDTLPSKISLTVPSSFRKKVPKGIVLYKANLDPSDVEMRDGFRITTPLRTVLDLARRHLDPERLTAVVKDAVRKGLLDRRALLSMLDKNPPGLDVPTQVTLQLAVREGE